MGGGVDETSIGRNAEERCWAPVLEPETVPVVSPETCKKEQPRSRCASLRPADRWRARILHGSTDSCTKNASRFRNFCISTDQDTEFLHLLVQTRLHELSVRGTRILHTRNTFVGAPCA